MKKLLILGFITHPFFSTLSSMELKCQVEYDSQSKDDISRDILMYGEVQENGDVLFLGELGGVSTYFFPLHRHTAMWHNHALVKMNARYSLERETLTYEYSLHSYKRSFDGGIQKLVSTKREVLIDQEQLLSEKEVEIDKDDGDLLVSYKNNEDWVVTSAIKFEGCKLSL